MGKLVYIWKIFIFENHSILFFEYSGSSCTLLYNLPPSSHRILVRHDAQPPWKHVTLTRRVQKHIEEPKIKRKHAEQRAKCQVIGTHFDFSHPGCGYTLIRHTSAMWLGFSFWCEKIFEIFFCFPMPRPSWQEHVLPINMASSRNRNKMVDLFNHFEILLTMILKSF